jgi:hypothetical protein
MTSVFGVIFYILTFLSVYVQVFFLVTFLENRKKIVTRKGKIQLANYPSVTIIVPCWNEEKSIFKSVNSLLHIYYPQDKLKIFLIDDGSTECSQIATTLGGSESEPMWCSPSATGNDYALKGGYAKPATRGGTFRSTQTQLNFFSEIVRCN